jgi:hypothetical protein
MRLPFRPKGEPQGVAGLERGDPTPERYPIVLSDDRLQAVLRDMIAGIPGFDHYDALLPELKLALILIGSQERARRDADRLGKRLLVTTVLATLVAVISLIVSIVLAASS